MTPKLRQQSLWILLGITFAVGLVWWALVPAWTAPDEPGHFLYARLWANLGRLPTRLDDSSKLEARLINSLGENNWWAYNRFSRPERLSGFSDDPVLAASGSQIGDEPPAYYLLPALALRFVDPKNDIDPAVLLRWLRLWSLALRLGTVVCAWALSRRLWPGRVDRAWTMGLLVGLLPMVGFIGGSLNNDALTMFWGALTFSLLALARRPRQWVLVFIVACAGVLLIDRGLLFYLIAVFVWAAIRMDRLRPYRLYLGIGLLLLLILALAPNPRWAAGWRRSPEFIASRSGGALMIGGSASEAGTLTQTLAGKQMPELRDSQVILQADVIESGSDLRLSLDDGEHLEQVSCATVSPCALAFNITPSAIYLQVIVEAGAPARLQLSLLDQHGRELLFNGGGSQPDLLTSPIYQRLERALPIPAGFFAQAVSASAWDAPAQFRYLLFALFTSASFWGYFGWLTRPFPWPVYVLLAGVTIMAAWGLSRRLQIGIRARKERTGGNGILTLSALTVTLVLCQVWLPMIGQSWQPQGRYLFPAILPIAILLALGWEAALPRRWRAMTPYAVGVGLVALNGIAWWVVQP
ncbi:MAG: DUF2142 domain-containing protein [Caldilineales bacterium]|nr:DUF2142 domain-containing protein [Caldilineales bacterium]